MKIAMIPARMGSQRLKQKNLQLLGGVPLITRAIRAAQKAEIFDEIWVNSEHPTFGKIAEEEGVGFHLRPEALANNTATSEQFVHEFLIAHPCEHLFQVHSIAPLLTSLEIRNFVEAMIERNCDVLLSMVEEQIECAMEGNPINFSFESKTNSQDLLPIQRIIWSITGWRRATYLEACESGRCATYAGAVDFYPLSRVAGHVIKTAQDLRIAECLLPIVSEI